MITNVAVYFIVCFLQPIVLPIPEPITIMTGSAIFGELNGAIIGFTGTTLGIVTMYLISRHAGEKFILKYVNMKKLEKFNGYIRKNETLILLLLFIFPLLPDEIICIGSGLAKLNIYKFITIAFIAKLITVWTLSYSIEILQFDIQTIVLCLTLGIIFIVTKSILQNRRRA